MPAGVSLVSFVVIEHDARGLESAADQRAAAGVAEMVATCVGSPLARSLGPTRGNPRTLPRQPVANTDISTTPTIAAIERMTL